MNAASSDSQKQDQWVIQNYCVCFMDLLGQRNALQGESLVPQTETEEKRSDFLQRVKNSIGPIIQLQERAEELVAGFLSQGPDRYGASKARFFGAFGFRAEQWETFARALREQGQKHDVMKLRETGFGPAARRAAEDGKHGFPRKRLEHGSSSPYRNGRKGPLSFSTGSAGCGPSRSRRSALLPSA